jgi:hypothetical protein
VNRREFMPDAGTSEVAKDHASALKWRRNPWDDAEAEDD